MRRICSILLGALCLSTALSAAAAIDRAPSATNPPLTAWKEAPAFFSATGAGRTALTDGAPPMPFIPLVPCRQYDSRSATVLLDNTSRTINLSGAPCGIPSSARAVAVNITVFNLVGSASNGVFKVGTSAPPATAWINYPFNETQRANAGVVPTNASAQIVVQVNQGAGSIDFVVDVFGYYGPSPANASNYFTLNTNSTGYTMFLTNSSVSCSGACGVYQSVGSGTAIWGDSSGTGSDAGVRGNTTSGLGVYGTSGSNVGVKGVSSTYNGVWAESTNQDGLFATGGRDGAFVQGARHGVLGISNAAAGTTFGVFGSSAAPGNASSGVEGVYSGTGGNAAGVIGNEGSAPNIGGSSWIGAGVRGNSAGGFGVFGVSNYKAVVGAFHDGTSGANLAKGLLGYKPGATGYAVYGEIGDFGGTGAKYFVEPHGSDPSKVIRYISLEGPESGTYFRGKARTSAGSVTIDVPDHFKMVSDEDGMTVHVTPVGQFAQIWVESRDLNQIVVRSTRDVDFDYIVHGVRRAFRNFNPVDESPEFRPESEHDRLPAGLPAEIRARLVRIGIYNPDGSLNMATAERLGWAQKWRDDAAKAKARQEAAAAKAK